MRRSVSDLSAAQRDAFRDALLQLKQPGPDGVAPYDRLVAIHGAVMSVRVRFSNGGVQDTNMAHWNIAFLPWHRQYLLDFEAALKTVDPTVDLPYWDWEDHSGALQNLFTPSFVGSLRQGAPAAIDDGNLFPFPVDPALSDGLGAQLARGTPPVSGWPPPPGTSAWLTDLRFSAGGRHELWAFRLLLEAGQSGVVTATHNAGHNFIGGHMARGHSPNDPVFWLHHANVDRLWAQWQQRFRAATGTAAPADWPDPFETSPFDGAPAPYGHRRDDLMWPWVGNFAGAFTSTSVSAQQAALLPTGLPQRRVSDVLDLAALGYDYA